MESGHIDWGLVLGAIGVIGIPVAVGITVTMASPSKKEFWFARGCFILAAILTLAALAWLTSEEPLGPGKIIAAGTIGCITAIGLIVGLDWISRRQELSFPKKPAESAGLFVACTLAPYPVKVPSDGRLYQFQPWPLPTENGGGGVIETTTAPGTDFRFSENSLGTTRCRITNYEDRAVLLVNFSLKLVFQEAIPQQNGTMQSGDVVLERPWPISIGQIEPGSSNAFVFYMTNYSAHYVAVTFPTEGTAQRVGNHEQKPIRLTVSNPFPISLFPVRVMEEVKKANRKSELALERQAYPEIKFSRRNRRMESEPDLPVRRVNGRMWQPGESGNPAGRPIGARGRFSQRFIADLTTAWEEHGATALARTATEYPDRVVGIRSHLIPKDVSVSITAQLPAGLDHDDWQALVGLVAAIKRSMPEAKGMKAEAVAAHVACAIEAYDPLPVIDVTT